MIDTIKTPLLDEVEEEPAKDAPPLNTPVDTPDDTPVDTDGTIEAEEADAPQPETPAPVPPPEVEEATTDEGLPPPQAAPTSQPGLDNSPTHTGTSPEMADWAPAESALQPAERKAMPELTATPTAGDDAACRAHWQRVLTGDPATVPDDIRALAGADDDTLPAEEQEYRLLGTVNRSWAVDNLGLSREQVRDTWPEQRAKLADELGVADDEKEVFLGLSLQQEDAPRREAGRRIYEQAYLAGLHGEKFQPDAEWASTLSPEDNISANALADMAYLEGAGLRRKWQPLAELVASGADAFIAAEEEMLSAPRVLAAAPDLLEAIDRMADLSPEELQTVLYLASLQAKGKQPSGKNEGMAARIARALRRGSADIGMGVLQALGNTGVAAMKSIGSGLGGGWGAALQNNSVLWDKRLQMFNRLKKLTQEDIRPLYQEESLRKAETFLLDAAEATPSAILAFCGGCGFATMGLSGMGSSIAEARLRAPEAKQELQVAAGLIGGAAQAGIYMGLTRIGGKMLEQSIGNFMKARGAGGGLFSMEGLKTAGSMALHGAELMAAGKLSAASDLALQELAARASGTASNIDWEQFGDNLTDIEANMREAAAMLPFLLIGAGRATLRHFRSPHAVLGEGHMLEYWGADEATREKIMRERNIDEATRLLRELIFGSQTWNELGFLPKAARIMCLLNADYFKGFQDTEVVRDFLKLPSEVSLIEPKIKVKERTEQQMAKSPSHALSSRKEEIYRNAIEPRMSMCLYAWDEWWQKSHIWQYTPRYRPKHPIDKQLSPRSERSAFYNDRLKDLNELVPERMRDKGIIAPRAEAERRALLRDVVQEIKDLSYQFLLGAFTVDSLYGNARGVVYAKHRAEGTRRQIIGQVARTVVDIGDGLPMSKTINRLGQYLIDYLLNRSRRGATPLWLKRTRHHHLYTLNRTSHEYDHFKWGGNEELREAMRVITGLRYCSALLAKLLPMTSDFHTALSRGMSHLQAYDHLLQRELGFNPEKTINYPMEKIRQSANVTDMRRYFADHCYYYDKFSKLTGLTLEKQKGDDGKIYWRLMRPDGFYSRWHANTSDVINDVGIGMKQYFLPFGKSLSGWIRKQGRVGELDFDGLKMALPGEFSGFDQLCAIARRDLVQYLQEDATRAQPGHLIRKVRNRVRARANQTPADVHLTPEARTDPGGNIMADAYTVINPISLMESRFRVFWERILNSRFVEPEDMGRFLIKRKYMTKKRYEEILRIAGKRKPGRHPRHERLYNVGDMNREMAKELTRFHLHYFLAGLDKQAVPDSLRHWIKLAAYCPPTSEAEMEEAEAKGVFYGYGGKMAMSWSNRAAARKVADMAADVDTLRRKLADKPLDDTMQSLFDKAGGMWEPQRYEQGWGFTYGGGGIMQGTPQQLWNLLDSPKQTWGAMTEDERSDLLRHLGTAYKYGPGNGGETGEHLFSSLIRLDKVLRKHPDLHRYAPCHDDPQMVVEMELDKEPDPPDLDDEPELNALKLHWGGLQRAGCTVRVVPKPAFLQEDKDAMSALELLDTLRHITTQRPYVDRDEIRWKGIIYGNLVGAPPPGLENWQSSLPLGSLFELLHNIASAENKDDFTVCGIPLKGSDLTAEDAGNLRLCTVYRWPKDLGRVNRLMPGYEYSANVDARTPYVVLCHQGVYLDWGHSINTSRQLHRSFLPLEFFTLTSIHAYRDDMKRLRQNLAWKHALDSIINWPDERDAMLQMPRSGVVGLEESLLRLCEDSGFSHCLDPDRAKQMSREQALLVNLASCVMDCLHTHDSPESLQQLRLAGQPLRDPETKARLFDMLYQCNNTVTEDTGRIPGIRKIFDRFLYDQDHLFWLKIKHKFELGLSEDYDKLFNLYHYIDTRPQIPPNLPVQRATLPDSVDDEILERHKPLPPRPRLKRFKKEEMGDVVPPEVNKLNDEVPPDITPEYTEDEL